MQLESCKVQAVSKQFMIDDLDFKKLEWTRTREALAQGVRYHGTLMSHTQQAAMQTRAV